MLTFVTELSSRQMLGDVDFVKLADSSKDEYPLVDSLGFVTLKDPILVGEVSRNGRTDVLMQPLFQIMTVKELKVKLSSYFIIESNEIRSMYENVLNMHRAEQSGIVIPQSRIELKPV